MHAPIPIDVTNLPSCPTRSIQTYKNLCPGRSPLGEPLLLHPGLLPPPSPPSPPLPLLLQLPQAYPPRVHHPRSTLPPCPFQHRLPRLWPSPPTSIVLASNHLPTTVFHNYDIDPVANSKAARLISSHPDLSKRMVFHTSDILQVSEELQGYEVVYLAALVGMGKEDKARVIDHLAKYMAPDAILLVRSAHGARAFLYPVVDPCDLAGFEVLSVFHPTDDVINSIVVARKCGVPLPTQNLASVMLLRHEDMISGDYCTLTRWRNEEPPLPSVRLTTIIIITY